MPAITAEPLKVKPGRYLTADIGRGPETLLVMASAPATGCRYVQDGDGQQWEVHFKEGRAAVIAEPERLAARARLVANAHKLGLMFRHTTSSRWGYHTVSDLHLVGCPRLEAPAQGGDRVTTSQYGPRRGNHEKFGPQEELRYQAVQEHRTRTATCDCIDNGELPAAEPAA